jgi:prepilin-type N-terminal cleavage/methylation domain-containing protein
MRTRPWSRTRGDDGFTLLELTVAMLVIAVVIVTLVGLQLSSVKTVAVARQRQAATALADQKLERLRALPYNTIQAGLLSTDSTLTTANDPRISSGRLGAPWNEALVTSTNQTEPELTPHMKATPPLNGIVYTVYTYVTHPIAADGTDSASAVDFWLTVVVRWSSTSTGNHFKYVTVRTRASYPAGCNGVANHPYAGPCQPFLYGSAGRTTGGITVSQGDQSQPAILGLAFNSAAEIFSNFTSQIGVEQTTSALAKAVNSGTNVDNTQTGQDTTTSAADIDPATTTSTGPFNTPVAASSATSNSISGLTGVLTLQRPGFASGGGVQSAVAATAAGNCQDLSGTVIATNQACASSQFGRVGTNEADLDLASIGGRDLPSMVLASMQPDPAAARSYEARFLTAAGGHCTGTSGDGCVAAGATRAITSLFAGGLPAGDSGDSLPSGFTGMVTGSNYTDTATAEAGINSVAANTSPQFVATRSGTVTYWNGSSYQAVNLNTTNTYNLGAVNAAYARSGTPTINISIAGTLKVTAPSTSKNAAPASAACQPNACTSTSNAGSLVATLTYRITSASGQLAYFTVKLDLGTVEANATYRAVPSA